MSIENISRVASVLKDSIESATLRKRCYSNPLCRCDTFYFHNLSLFSVQPSMLFILTEVVSKNVRERWEGVLGVIVFNNTLSNISVVSWWFRSDQHIFWQSSRQCSLSEKHFSINSNSYDLRPFMKRWCDLSQESDRSCICVLRVSI